MDASSQPVVVLAAVAGFDASVPVVGSITARVIGMNEPSAKTGSPFGTVMVIELTPSLRVSVRS